MDSRFLQWQQILTRRWLQRYVMRRYDDALAKMAK